MNKTKKNYGYAGRLPLQQFSLRRKTRNKGNKMAIGDLSVFGGQISLSVWGKIAESHI